jgi:hypothetical protein
MNSESPNLEKDKHLTFLQDTSTPFDKYSEIIDNVLNKQYLEFVGRKKAAIFSSS